MSRLGSAAWRDRTSKTTAAAVEEFRRSVKDHKRRELEMAADLTSLEVTIRGSRADFLVIDEIHPKGEPMTAAPETDDVISTINAAIKAQSDELVFQIVGPLSTAANVPSKAGIRTVPFKGGEELLFRGVRAGKRNEFVFEFAPLDAQEYDRVEFVERKVFPALVGFEPAVVKMLVPDAPDTMGWGAATLAFRARVEAEKKLAEEAEALEAAGDRTHTNPNYGMFA